DELPGKIGNMLKSPNADIRRCALYAICEMKNFDNFVIVRKMLNDKDLNVAITASEVLKQFEATDDYKNKLQDVISKELEEEKRLATEVTDSLVKEPESISEIDRKIIHQLRSDNAIIRNKAITTVLSEQTYGKIVYESLQNKSSESEKLAQILFKILNSEEIETQKTPLITKPVKKAGDWVKKKNEIKAIPQKTETTSNKKAIFKILIVPFIMIFVAVAFFIYKEHFDPDNTISSNQKDGKYSPTQKSIKENLTFFTKLQKISESPKLSGAKKKKVILLLLVRYSHLFDDTKYEKYRIDICAERFSKVSADQ
ncbi:hypothetical protein KAJ27_11080, partial [bacterium]|nr:hypothetical protein [bacterium]